MLAQAIGGAIAVVVGVCMTKFVGQSSGGSVEFGRISVEDSVVAMAGSNLTNCAAESLTDSSLGTSSVLGGAFAMYHLPQVFQFRQGSLVPLKKTPAVTGFNLT
jgi:hypothetical protein